MNAQGEQTLLPREGDTFEGEVEEKDPGGRPPYVATAKDRAFVEHMAACGIVEQDIADTLDIARNTLRKHFKVELRRGRMNMIANVAHAMYKRATNPQAPGGAIAGIYILKTRGGPNWAQSDDGLPIAPLEAKDGAVFYFPKNGRET